MTAKSQNLHFSLKVEQNLPKRMVEVSPMTIGMVQEALHGLQNNQRRAEQAAQDIVRAGTGAEDAPDYPDAAVRLMTARRGFEACLAVARAGDEMIGTVIDQLA